MIRAAVLGCTPAGAHHANAYADHPSITLVGIHDTARTTAERIAARHGIPAFGDVEELVAQTSPELVTIRLPLAERKGAILAALAAGAHVLANLPLAEDDAGVLEIGEATLVAGKIVAGDFHLRFNPAIDAAVGWVDEGSIGTPLFINMNLFTAPRPDDPAGIFRNLGAHAYDIMRLFCGDATRAQTFRCEATESADSAQIALYFENETLTECPVIGHLTLSQDLTERHPFSRLELAGTKGRLTIDNVYEEATLFVHEDPQKHSLTNNIFGGIPQLADTFRLRIDRLVEQIELETPPAKVEGGMADILAAQRAMVAAERSAETGAPVEVEVTA